MSKHPIERLIKIMAALRNPDTGCPWDREQTFETIAPYTIEEAYEVADAIGQNDMTALKDELGDLLFQVVFMLRCRAKLAGSISMKSSMALVIKWNGVIHTYLLMLKLLMPKPRPMPGSGKSGRKS